MSRVLSALRKAETEVERLQRSVAEWEADASAKAAELADLNRQSLAAVTAQDPATAVRETAIRQLELGIYIDGARGAAKHASQELMLRREDLTMAQAAEKREQAAKVTADADALEGKVNALLRQLTELDEATYVPQPPADAAMIRQEINFTGRYEYPTASRILVLREQAADLMDAVESVEAPVKAARAARESAVQPVKATADIQVPNWDDAHNGTMLVAQVSEGVGSVTFDVSAAGMVDTVTLPDDRGRRMWSKRVDLRPGQSATIQADGETLETVRRPGRLLGSGDSLELASCPRCRGKAAVEKRANERRGWTNPDGAVEVLWCPTDGLVKVDAT